MVFSLVHADAWSGVREKVLPCDLVVDGGDIGQVSNRSIGIKKKSTHGKARATYSPLSHRIMYSDFSC